MVGIFKTSLTGPDTGPGVLSIKEGVRTYERDLKKGFQKILFIHSENINL